MGGGGFAHVFRARAPGGRDVAVKVATRADSGRFAREAAALSALGPPLTPALIASGTAPDGRPYLVMDVIAGIALSDFMARESGGALPLHESIRVFAAACAAVDRMHAAGVLHRDLKPENMFVRGDGTVVLIDFGLATSATVGGWVEQAAPDLTEGGEQLGTVLYMAPEQCRGDGMVTRPSDLYALGVIMFELLTGRVPFVGPATEVARAHVSRRAPRVTASAPLPAAVDDVAARALAKLPGDRYESAGELARALVAALGDAERGAPRQAQRSHAERRPVALLWVDGGVSEQTVRAATARFGGEVAGTAHGGWVVVFAAAQPEAGVHAATRAVHQLGERVRSTIHVAELRTRRGRRGALVSGAALDGEWAAPDTGSRLTPAAARYLDAADLRAVGDSWFERTPDPRLAAAHRVAVMRGRGGVCDAITAEARRCWQLAAPAITTVLGEPGLGKTRLLDELVARVDAGGVVHRCAGHDLLPALARIAFRADAPAAMRGALTAQVGVELADAVWPILQPLLGHTAPRAAPAAAGAAFRHTAARAIGELLRAAARVRPLAVIVDDAHRADFIALDALEIAALAEGAVPLWVCVSAGDQLRSLRPAWGDRACAHHQHALAPLDARATAELLTDLLHPVDYLPDQVLAPLVEVTGGVPLHVVELAGGLRAAGAIVPRGTTGEWTLAVGDLLAASATPLMQRIAQRILGDLPDDLGELVSLCAVLGDEVRVAELRAVDRVVLAAGADSTLDPVAGLEALARRGIVSDCEGGYRFRDPMVRAAIEAATDAAKRERVHAAALAAIPIDAVARRARHAAGAGDHAAASAAQLALAETADAEFRYADAEQHYTAALDHLEHGDDRARQRALAGRGRTRYAMGRHAASLDDLEAALAIALARGERAEIAELLLEKATLLDWSYALPQAAAAAEQALPLAEASGDARLRARAMMALGRAAWRGERLDEAVALLADAAALARALGDTETRIVALAARGMALLLAERLDESEADFAAALDACQATGDRLHAGACHVNRMNLWAVRQDYERSVADGSQAIAIARELGNFQLERAANFNVAELMLWRGELDQAMPRAQRARQIQQRFSETATEHDALLVARIAVASGDPATAREMLAWIAGACDPSAMTPSQQVLLRLVELCSAPAMSEVEWDALLQSSARSSMPEERLEVLLAAATEALGAGHRARARALVAEGLTLAGSAAHWQARFAALRGRAA